MFALETDHLQQRISDEDYVAQKAALELVLRRALQRIECDYECAGADLALTR